MSQADLVYRIVAIIFPVFSIVAIGYFYARHRHETDMSSGNRINMEIFTPALIFDYMSGSDYALTDYLYLSLGCVFVVLGSGVIAWPVARALGYQWKTLVPPMMFNNCGNMGLPLVVLAFGESMLPAAIRSDPRRSLRLANGSDHSAGDSLGGNPKKKDTPTPEAPK